MPISDSDAVKFGLLVKYAEDTYDDTNHNFNFVKLKNWVEGAGWEIIAYLQATDTDPDTKDSTLCLFGFLAQNIADRTAHVAAIRGTKGKVEWKIDEEFALIRYGTDEYAQVENGFWSIYDSMNLVTADGKKTVLGKAAPTIADKVGAGQVTVAGHSLGSAIATYLSLDLVGTLEERVSAVLFALPRPGNSAFAALYDLKLQERYRLINYLCDAVPYLPYDAPLLFLQYSTLPRQTLITPFSSQAQLEPKSIGDNHMITSYCAMLDYQGTMANDKEGDVPGGCVVGPHQPLSEADALFVGSLLCTPDRAQRVDKLNKQYGSAS